MWSHLLLTRGVGLVPSCPALSGLGAPGGWLSTLGMAVGRPVYRGQQGPSPWQRGRGPDKTCSTLLPLEATCILTQREWTVWHVKGPRGQAPPPRKPASSPQATVLTSPASHLGQIGESHLQNAGKACILGSVDLDEGGLRSQRLFQV